MKIVSFVLLSCILWKAQGYRYYPYYGSNVDSLSFGASDSSRGGMVMSRYYNPYYNPRMGGGMAAFMVRQPEDQAHHVQPSQYYLPDRRRQTPPETNLVPPQENEVYYPLLPNPKATEVTEIADQTDKTEAVPTTVKTVPELIEPEVEEVEPKSKKRVSKKKKPQVDDEEDDEYPRMPAGAFFPMFFGGRSGTPGGATAIANAYSTGRGGVASSHATAYGAPQSAARPDLTPNRINK